MAYDWEDKEDECYNLYIEQSKPLEEVMKILQDRHRGFNPSKRAFQAQFKEWDFPVNQVPAHQNRRLVQRVRQLFETGTSLPDMVRILGSEGFEASEKELKRLMVKQGWVSNTPPSTQDGHESTLTLPTDEVRAVHEEDPSRHEAHSSAALSLTEPEGLLFREQNAGSSTETTTAIDIAGRRMTPSEITRIQELHLARFQEESDARWQKKKRRRRTRGYGGLGPDPPGPPRYGSETTLDEAKSFLKLDNAMYQQVREAFQGICKDTGIVKKTTAGAEKWQGAKLQLIAHSPHLHEQFHGAWNGVSTKNKERALDVICMDVVKRERGTLTKMTISDAKKALNLHPSQLREVRQDFYDRLDAHHFQSKVVAGNEYWEELKQQWIDDSPVLTRLLEPEASLETEDLSADISQRKRALEIMCRDVMKRLRDDRTKVDPSLKKQLNIGPGPGPARPRSSYLTATEKLHSHATGGNQSQRKTRNSQSLVQRPRPETLSLPYETQSSLTQAEMQIDPSLLPNPAQPSAQPQLSLLDQLHLYAAEVQANPTRRPPRHRISNTINSTTKPQTTLSTAPPAPRSDSTTGSIAVYFRLSPTSPHQASPKLWLGTLSAFPLPSLTATDTIPADSQDLAAGPTLAEVHARITAAHPGATIARVEGAAPDRAGGQDVLFAIDGDDELEAYLAYVVGRKPTFAVTLVAG